MSNMFSESKKRELYFLSEKGVGIHSFNLNNDLDIYEYMDLLETIQDYIIFEKLGFIKLGNLEINFKGYIEDVFLQKYKKLITNNQIKNAKKLATEFGLHILNKIYENKIQIKDMATAEAQFKQYGLMNLQDGPLGRDLCSLLNLKIEIKNELIELITIEGNEEDAETKDDIYTQTHKGIIFEEKESSLFINQKKCPIKKHSRQYELIKVIVSDTKKEWQFSEIAEKIDQFHDFEWKKIYNWCNSLEKNIGYHTQLKNFFITTTQSVTINPKYLNNNESNSTLDDF